MKIALSILIAGSALGSIAQADTLYCSKPGNSDAGTIIIEENFPEVGLATVTHGESASSVVQFTNKVEVKEWGCTETVTTTKVFFHPYYDYVLTNTIQQGKDMTRCAGMNWDVEKIYKGVYSAEMQKPVELVCTAASALSF